LQDDEEQYELSAAIFHIGSYANRGHYTVMAKGFDNRYYYFDDISVRRVHSMTMVTIFSSYMLFYSRTGPQKRVPVTGNSSIVRSKTSSSSGKICSKRGRNTVVSLKTSLDKPKARIPSSFSPRKDVIKATEPCFPTGNRSSVKSSPSSIAKAEESSTNDSSGDPALKSITTDNILRNLSFKSAGHEVKNLSEVTQNSSSFPICDDDHYDVGMNTTMEGNENIWNSSSHGEKTFKPGESGTTDSSHSTGLNISFCESKFGKLDFNNSDHVNNNVGSGCSNTRSRAFNEGEDDIGRRDSKDVNQAKLCLQQLCGDSDMEKHGKGFAKDHQVRSKHSTEAFHNQNSDELSGQMSRRRRAQVKL
uniref:USP domain-containing protein n=1 Tax=Angiostrongylus cantonensis TaxID=6313 RepID=A0A0K0D406_ANGCA